MSGSSEVSDALFGDPRLARLYDVFDGNRSDLDLYVALLQELGARRVLDLGCGTGTLAVRLAALGFEVLGVDPAQASLDVARAKPGADRVAWHRGDALDLPACAADAAVMAGNVAQAILGQAWPATLGGLRGALRPGGHLVFESRVPARRAWEGWTPELTLSRRHVPDVGEVEAWCQVTEVSEPLVSFRWTYAFPDGTVLTSDSTLQFRTLDELANDVESAGFDVVGARDAPDRPGQEHVLTCRCR